MGMAAIWLLVDISSANEGTPPSGVVSFNGAEPFELIVKILKFYRRPHVKSSENCSSYFREEEI